MENDREEDRGQKIIDLYDKLTAMPEYEVLEKVKALEISKYVLQGNYTELRDLLTSNIDINKFRGLREAERRLKKTASLFETIRLFHNFVTSVRSYVEHTGILYLDLYKNAGTMPEYEQESERRFAKSPLVHFIEDLHEYCLRFQAPPVSSSLYWSQMNAVDNTGIRLDKNELGKYSKWSPAGKEYLENQDNHINFLVVITEYYAVVMDFCEWFQSQQKEIHADSIKRVNALQEEIKSLLNKEYSRY